MFNNSLRGLLYLTTILIFSFVACEDSTSVGSEIFENEDLEVFFDDDIELITRTVRVAPYENYRTGVALNFECLDGSLPVNESGNPQIHYLGVLDDPDFGKRKANIYTEVIPGAAPPDFLNATLDSLVLVLAYDTSAVYGDTIQPFDVEVYRVLEDMGVTLPAFSNTEFQISEEPIATRTNITYSLDTLSAFLPEGETIQQPAIRIQFPPFVLGDEDHLPSDLINNPAVSADVEDFTNFLRGFFITVSSESNIMMGLDLTQNNLLSRLEMFYTDSDGEKEQYDYFLVGKVFNNVVSDPSGTPAEAALAATDQTQLYVSGQDGFDITIDIADALRFQDFALNHAELEFTLSEPTGASAVLFPPSNNLIISEIGDNNELTCIDDMVIGVPNVLIGSLFGGALDEVDENGTVLRKYRMNITAHVQNFLEGETTSNLLLSVDNRSENVRRTILFGPSHPTFPARLKLTYTAP